MSATKEASTYTQLACVGTGFTGIGLGATLKRWYDIGDIRFFERHSKLGGTWFANQYPGCACDIPSALYSFSFEPNPDWSRVMPRQQELWNYLNGVAEKYALTDKMVFGVNVESCEWSEARDRWRMTIRRYGTDDVFTHECQFLFTATGQLMTPRPLDVPGQETFRGPVFHSSRWDSNVAIEGKRVVVFGNGCTAAQIVPAIVDRAASLTQVIRSRHWVMPPVDGETTTRIRAVHRYVPGTLAIQRFLVFLWAEDSLRGFYETSAGRRYRRDVQARVQDYMRATAPEEYHGKLIPDFELGCKRRVFDAGYLASLHAEKLTLLDDPVLEIVPRGIRTKDGVVEADVIVLANGFVTDNAVGGLNVVGRGGETIEQHWTSFGGPEAYNCTIMNGFPNFFCLLGPNSLTGHTSAIIAAENSINFALRVIRPLLEGKGTVVEVKREAERRYVDRMQDDMQKTVWFTGCSSWYLQKSTKGDDGQLWNSATWPYSQTYLWYRCLFPKFNELDISGSKHQGQWRSRKWQKTVLLALAGYILSIRFGLVRNPLSRNRYWQQFVVISTILRLTLKAKLAERLGRA
ncbi:Baeyer-Villiger monooxygenase [Colletotrichum trifolii]|uniref:Baeyer-Villiger monooxygenase n=1 Tax=Colletotrichum trifolii TaxID=5466 RepID=A0A4R8QVV5_COLTR|nr:Baeyer-Villiger monooxygenase [Colletotrichum trifolii]